MLFLIQYLLSPPCDHHSKRSVSNSTYVMHRRPNSALLLVGTCKAERGRELELEDEGVAGGEGKRGLWAKRFSDRDEVTI